MSFLLGAFGKMSAGRRQREIEAQKLRIQSRLRIATKQIGIVDKQIARQEQADKNYAKQFINQVKSESQKSIVNSIPGLNQTSSTGLTNVDPKSQNDYALAMNDLQCQVDFMSNNLEQQIADYYERVRDTQLEPLKQEEDLLKTELEQLESQALLAKNDLEFCQKMEEGGAKELAPKYTGS